MRPWMAALLLVLISCVAVLVGGGEPEAAALRGVVKGLVSFALLWWVLRYDLRTIPAFLATGTLLDSGTQRGARRERRRLGAVCRRRRRHGGRGVGGDALHRAAGCPPDDREP